MTRSSIPRRGDQGAMLVATMLALALIAVVGPITGIASLPTGSLPNWLIGPFQAAAPKPANWSQFRNTPTLTGVAASPLPPTLRLQWTYEAGSAIESSAAVVDGVAYVGTSGGALVAIDAGSGKLKWSYRATSDDLGIGESSPAVANGVVYIGDLAGVFHAVDAATGKARWTYKTGAEIKSSPVVTGNTVLIGSYDGHLYGLNAATGAFLWKAGTDNYVHSTPAIWNGVAYFGGCDEVFHGVRISDGTKVLSLATQAYTAASPAIAAGVAYYGTFANEVVAVDIAAKRVKWRFLDPDRQFPFYSSAALSVSGNGGTMVLGGRDKNVRALDMGTGKQRWSFTTRARVESSPAIAGTRVIVGSSDGKLYVLDLASGKKLWEFDAAAPFTASPAVADGRVIIGDGDGRLYAFGQ
jgi:outer membrane protein assembly factor BamB